MPGLDRSQVSSNWKKLQEKLQAEKKQNGDSHGLKRTRPAQQPEKANGYKKIKLAESRPVRPSRRLKMGMNGSKNEQLATKEQANSNLAKDHGISREDISAAYGTPNGALRKHADDINGGLHSTNKAGKYIALDCEMVGTGPPPYLDHVLARVSLVNFHGEQIYDSYVLPPPVIEVKDYRTFVSGIKPHHLKPGYARSFTEVQKGVASLMQDRILVGHALRNDLQCLLLSHPRRDMRDTSRYPKFREQSMGKPPALRFLAKSELGMDIQTGEHSSIEDARAAMMLFRKEKVGFEEENRKRFGRRPTVERQGGKNANGSAAVRESTAEASDEDDEDMDDFELLDGEEEDEERVAPELSTMPKVKKKRKKKKRTKRK